jgi:hypothetical protein
MIGASILFFTVVTAGEQVVRADRHEEKIKAAGNEKKKKSI